MKGLQTIEMYCGTKSFSKEALHSGYETFTVDINKRFKPDLEVNILHTSLKDYPFQPHILWASPDCRFFSPASAWKYWNRDNTPKNHLAEMALQNMVFLLDLIEEIQPLYWFLENPRGKLRKMECMQDFTRHTITYCQYGEQRRKPTDIWTNNPHWKPRPICEHDADCHPILTETLSTPSKKGVIPPTLIQEILSSCTK